MCENQLPSVFVLVLFLYKPSIPILFFFKSGEAFAHHPEAWEGFISHIRDSNPDWETERQNLLGAYYRRLCSSDPEVVVMAMGVSDSYGGLL